MQSPPIENNQVIAVAELPLTHRLADWIQDPMGGVIVASAAIIGSFGVVLSGSWFIHMVIN